MFEWPELLSKLQHLGKYRQPENIDQCTNFVHCIQAARTKHEIDPKVKPPEKAVIKSVSSRYKYV